MDEKTFSKVCKFNEDLMVRIPRDDRDKFKVGDPVWIEKITSA